MPIHGLFGVGALLALLGGARDTLPANTQPGRWHLALRAPVLEEPGPAPEDLLHRAALAVAAGAPERARGLLERYPMPPGSPFRAIALRVLAAATYADGDYPPAGRYFAAAARAASGVPRGILEARAADAFERAGQARAARDYYRAALRRLPEAAGWIAIRLARLMPDTAEAFELLGRAPPQARILVRETRAQLLAQAGAVGRAVSELVAAGLPARGAGFALMGRDTVRARRLIYSALAGRDSGEVLVALDLLAANLRARNRDEGLAAGRAFAAHGRYPEAVRWYRDVVAAGDSSPATLLVWGQAVEAARDWKAALRIYAVAVRRGDSAPVADAEFARARLLLRTGRAGPGITALLAFARSHADHPAAPLALVAVADERQRTGAGAGARRVVDSLYQVVIDRWPASRSASDARLALAGLALQRRDLVRARQVYAVVAREQGPAALAARFVLAKLARQAGDTLAALEEWTALAHDDPLGYYGTLARQSARLAPPSYTGSEATPDAAGIGQVLAHWSLLDAMGFDAEAETSINALLAQDGYTSDELLDLADGLVARGRTGTAAMLGWRAARQLTLENPRVLRVIFPWPWRRLIQAEAQEFGIDPYLLAAVIRQESGFRAAAVSRAGAWGLMQLMPGTAARTASRLGLPWRERFLTVPDANVHMGAAHLAMLLRHYRGALVTALAAYNAGARPVERWAHLPGAGDPFWFVERIPYPETQGYVRSVMRNRALYRALYPPVAEP